jgi:site-specific DNA recombinase
MTARAAIYARFSSDLQRDRSIEDQVALCREYAVRNGYNVVAVFSDRAITGSSFLLRRGIQDVLKAARAGEFDFVIAESLSRIARDQEDAPAIRKRLDFAGVKIVTTADGVVSPLMHGLRTIIDSQYLDDLKAAVRRGMAGVVRDGRHAGGSIYGYRSVPGKPGELVIVPEQAEIIRRIFREYIAGDVPRTIAARLNSEAIPAPRKSYWRASTINGHTKRRTGILQNELYCGRLIWNRAYRVRDPDNGQRVWRYKADTDWQRAEVPHLRIIDDEIFAEVQRLRAVRARPHLRPHTRPKRILSGLLRCGCCGAGMSKKDIDHGRPRIVCTRMQEANTCSNRRRYYLDDIERIVVGGLREHLGTREAIGYYVRCYNEERRRVTNVPANRRRDIEKEITQIDRQIERAVSAIIEGRITEAEASQHLPALRQHKAELAFELGALATRNIITLRPAAVDAYLRDLSHLDQVINADLAEGDQTAARVVRQMIETVTIAPTARGEVPGVIVRGQLGSILGLDGMSGLHVGGADGAG